MKIERIFSPLIQTMLLIFYHMMTHGMETQKYLTSVVDFPTKGIET